MAFLKFEIGPPEKNFPIFSQKFVPTLSIFQPLFSQPTQFTATPQEDDGCEEPGCYEDIVTYRFFR